MKYTIRELTYLNEIRSIGFNENADMDDHYGTDHGFYKYYTKIFFEWLSKMERNGKISELLSGIDKWESNGICKN